MGKVIDLTGQKFGKLTVIKQVGLRHNQALWLCECDCDNHTQIEVVGHRLRDGGVTDCGCVKKYRPQPKLRKKNTYEDKGDYYEGKDARGNIFFD